MTEPDRRGDWPRAREYFLDLADADPETRSRTLDDLAQEDPELCRWVRRLLAEDLGRDPAPAREAMSAERIGAYTVLEHIGEGGFGQVYRARQEVPVVREVALKVLKAGIESPQMLARFEDERKYLARIDHPDVVKILDAGKTAEGRLFVAMELVRGEPITTYVDHHGVSLAGRVALAARVARAVHHVHQRAIIHRDLKPTNILVSTADGEPHPRIIDFGIATAVSEAERSGWTQVAGPIFTPTFASPEQLAGDDRIDIRTDVYALGAVLCELLTGERPRERITASETPARPPSTLVPPGDERIVTQRHLRGDLDRIILKCVAWSPDERYDSAAALADDLDRYLRDEPVRAAPASRLYLARKFVRRNRMAVGSVAVALVAVLAGLALALDGRARALRQTRLAQTARHQADDEADRARAEEQRAAQSLDDAIAAIDEMLRQGSEPELATRPGGDPARRQLLLRALELYEGLLEREKANPGLKTRVIVAQVRVARLQRELGDYDASVRAAERALELCDEAGPGAAIDGHRADAQFALLVAFFELSRPDEFRAVCEDLIALRYSPREDVAAAQSLQRVMAMQLLARLQQREGDVTGALEVLDRVIETCEDLLERRPDDEDVLSELAVALHHKGYYGGFDAPDTDFAPLFERAVGLLERVRELQPHSPWAKQRLAKVLSNWAHLDIRRGHAAEALPRAERAHEMLSSLCNEFPLRELYVSSFLTNAQCLGWAYRFNGDELTAEDVMQAAIDFGREAGERLSPSDGTVFMLAMLQSELAYRLGLREEFERADELWLGSRAAWEALMSRAEPPLSAMLQVGTFYDNLARYQESRDDLEAAEASAISAVEWHDLMLERTGNTLYAGRIGKTLPLLAQVQLRRGRLDAAVETLRRAIEGGYIDPGTLKHPTYDGLRDRSDFQALTEDRRE